MIKYNKKVLLFAVLLKGTSVNYQLNKTKNNKLSNCLQDIELTSSILKILYERNGDRLAVNSVLMHLCLHLNVSRCWIMQSFNNGNTYICTDEWYKDGLRAYIDKQIEVQSHNLQPLFTLANEHGTYACENTDSFNLKSDVSDVFFTKQAKAFMHSQVKKDDIVAFYITVEDNDKRQKWTESQINIIQYVSRILYTILHNQNMVEEIKRLSNYNKVSAFVAENTDNFIYIVDPDTYDIIHMNKKALAMYNNPSKSEVENKKCYELLHNKTQPCEFCTNDKTKEDEFYEWRYFNPRFNRTYLFKDKLVSLNDKLVKLQVATDISNLVNLEIELKDKLDEQTLLLECIKILHSSQAPDACIEKILENMCEFFMASRGVVLQISQSGDIVSNTHEWTDKFTKPRKQMLQNMPIETIKPFFDKFLKTNAMHVENVIEKFEKEERLKDILYAQSVKNIICAPILDDNGIFIGMFSVDNPKRNTDKYWLVGSLSGFVSDFLGKNKLVTSLNNLSYYDTLTGAKNRHSYRKELKEMDEANLSSLGVAYVDIAGLSKINEEKGTLYGDKIIKTMASILNKTFEDNFFRVGGDEFVVLDKNVDEIAFESKIKFLKDIISAHSEINASIGFTWNTNVDSSMNDGSDETTSFRGSKNYTTMLRKNLEYEIKGGKFEVYLQPQINLKTNKLDGAEALIRRIDASGNAQSPISFVPFYEKEGMISQIDFFVFEKMCEILQGWNKRDLGTNIKFSVNFSRATVMEKNLINKLNNICQKYNTDKSRFIVEITETISHTNDKVFSMLIASLKNAGFCVSLDDFGSGYANLSSLLVSDFDEIKIDMGITKDVHRDETSKILTKVALNLCTEFKDMVSVAEGIETIEQFNVLKDLNCEKGQGYFFSKPISIKDFENKYFVLQN